MEWLDCYTFPRERLHIDPSIAGAEYAQLVQRLLLNGTTCALFFGSLHLEACKVLAQVAVKVSLLHDSNRQLAYGASQLMHILTWQDTST